MFTKQSVLVLSACVAVCFAATLARNKREAYELPDGIEEYIGSIKNDFLCTRGGYFADVANNCQLFHICLPHEDSDGKSDIIQYTFACGNQTIFNQFSMTCTSPDEAIPCAQASDFFYLNQRIGKETAKIHEDTDVEKAASYLPARN